MAFPQLHPGVIARDLSGYLLCTYIGPYRHPDLSDAARTVSERCSATGAVHVLFDVRRSVGELTVAERLKIASEMVHYWDPEVRLGVLCRHDQASPERPWEEALTRRGFQARGFVDSRAAVEWLLAP